MTIFTRYGSQVKIKASFKTYADCNAFLVQAEVIQPAQLQTTRTEEAGEIIGQNDAFNRGWIPATHLVSDSGPQELLRAVLDAPNATPSNVHSLLRMYWPSLFGQMQLGDVVNVTTIIADQPSVGGLSGVLRRFGGNGAIA